MWIKLKLKIQTFKTLVNCEGKGLVTIQPIWWKKIKTNDLRRNMGTGQYLSRGGVGRGFGGSDFGVITIKFTRLCNILINLLAVNWQSTLPVNFASYPFMLWWLRLTPRCFPWEQWRPSKSSHCNISKLGDYYKIALSFNLFSLRKCMQLHHFVS